MGCRHVRGYAFEHQRFVEYADVREVPVALCEVEPVADDKRFGISKPV
jgi:hypothetical protein